MDSIDLIWLSDYRVSENSTDYELLKLGQTSRVDGLDEDIEGEMSRAAAAAAAACENSHRAPRCKLLNSWVISAHEINDETCTRSIRSIEIEFCITISRKFSSAAIMKFKLQQCIRGKGILPTFSPYT